MTWIDNAKKVMGWAGHKVSLYRWFIFFWAGVFIAIWFAGFIIYPQTKYESENIITESEIQNTAMDISYTYYLDISPSMLGYMNVDGSLKGVSQALRTVNQNKENLHFYSCASDIEARTEPEFYGLAEDAENIREEYSRVIIRADLEDTVNALDLSNIFTDLYSDGKQFAGDENNVNLIISDFNFMRNEQDEEQHNMYMQQFARTLSGNSQDANVCIYNIRSDFNGFHYDEYSQNDSQLEMAESSFFVIILSRNNRAYDAFVEEMNNELERRGIETGNRYELKNDMLGDAHEITPDLELFKEAEPINTLTNFNRNSKYFRSIDENPLGLQIVKDSSGISSLQLALGEWDFPGYYGAEETRETEIEAQVRLYDARIWGYTECEDTSGITYCAGKVRRCNDKWYLYVDMEILQNLNGQAKGIVKKYCVADVLLLLRSLGYAIPDWVKELNTEHSSDDISRKINILELFEQISDSKADSYLNRTSDYMRKIGNVKLYISY